ncbi:hypothetical protein GCM10023196_060630 [Actinoallomurus vinaceus]|uniref:ATP-binding protein n=1 Tax=Actinoallomurus vinaceus TaxID=1080074 RepID=A0ABP8UJB8_9ACTN
MRTGTFAVRLPTLDLSATQRSTDRLPAQPLATSRHLQDRLTDDGENGRGLAILNALTTCWGWHGDVRGRTVTAIFLG